MDDIVETIYKRFQDLIELLNKQNEVSLKSDVDDYYKKIMVLTIASYFESKISDILINFFQVKSSSNECVVSFVKRQALERKYYTFFNWEGKNANSFFSMFGDDFKKSAGKDVEHKPELEEAIKAFLEITNDRNLLIHNNLGIYSIEKTAKEVMDKYKKALKFIDYIADKLT